MAPERKYSKPAENEMIKYGKDLVYRTLFLFHSSQRYQQESRRSEEAEVMDGRAVEVGTYGIKEDGEGWRR